MRRIRWIPYWCVGWALLTVIYNQTLFSEDLLEEYLVFQVKNIVIEGTFLFFFVLMLCRPARWRFSMLTWSQCHNIILLYVWYHIYSNILKTKILNPQRRGPPLAPGSWPHAVNCLCRPSLGTKDYFRLSNRPVMFGYRSGWYYTVCLWKYCKLPHKGAAA